MPIYEFGGSFEFNSIEAGTVPTGMPVAKTLAPRTEEFPITAAQTAHAEGGRVHNTWEGVAHPADVEEFINPAFHWLDTAMKHYWSDLRIPSKDSFRFVRTKIAGMRTSLQVWTEALKHGRVKLPVIAVSRGTHEYNPEKFSPPYRPLWKRYVNSARTRAAGIFRPVPYNVEYTLSIWAEHKRDAEYILYQILTRFNPLAELKASDGHNIGCVQMKMNSSNDASEKEVSSEQYAKVKYEVTYVAEAWLSMPEKVMPTILGTVVSLRERTDRVSESDIYQRSGVNPVQEAS